MVLSLYRPRALRAAPHALFSDTLDRLFADALLSRPSAGTGAKGGVRSARLQVIEKADRFEAQVELPGVTKEDIEVEVVGSSVQVSAKLNATAPVAEGERVLYTEREAGRYVRRFELPSEVADDAVVASFENGVLALVLPKREETKARRVPIQ